MKQVLVHGTVAAWALIAFASPVRAQDAAEEEPAVEDEARAVHDPLEREVRNELLKRELLGVFSGLCDNCANGIVTGNKNRYASIIGHTRPAEKYGCA